MDYLDAWTTESFDPLGLNINRLKATLFLPSIVHGEIAGSHGIDSRDRMMRTGFTLDRAVSETLVHAFKAKAASVESVVVYAPPTYGGNIAYCIAMIWGLNSENPVAGGERMVAKVIRDGTIDATIDHANGWMVSKEIGNVYSTNEPQLAFSSRIAFCLNMHMRPCMP
ncbi:hypothetical protein IFM89_034582 [Coptis chinensis]|uniref:Uncharacterized protein n=1 Tax=Coptis chinensis TaxID=261450 RepID=A0A835LTZ1_9MAGN|nr:hypothetical protein IFM89_034582 [Coptis chinensis]